MALKKILTIGSLLAAMIVGQQQSAEGQTPYTPSARFEHRNIEEADETMPLATPGIFDYDAQMFAPVDFLSEDEMEPRIGFYLSFDKTYLSVSGAPRTTINGREESPGNNFIWGNRYNFGYYAESEKGWQASFQSNNGIAFANGRDILLSTPTVVDTTFASFEINRMFRQSSGNGTVLEPYVGLRYFGISDETFETVSTTTTDNRFKQKATNSVIGFQAGARHSRRAGRWRFTTDGVLNAAYNQQRLSVLDIFDDGTNITSVESAVSDQAFVPALDLEYNIAFNVTRDITLKTGVQFNYLWTGITRANAETTINNPNSFTQNGGLATLGEDNDFIAAGFVFGFEWRR